MANSKQRYTVQLSNSNKNYYFRKTLRLTVEVLQPTKHHRDKTVEWLNGEFEQFKGRIGAENGVVRVYHDI